ncbi:MAG: alpha/beta fold hydrolase, partial [Geminicoccaceae bacterium]
PALGRWKIGGHIVRPEQLDLPAFLAIPYHDRIVPAGSALALAALLPRAEIIRPQSGHIGMVAGQKAKKQLWKPLLAWLLQIAAMQKKDG